MPLTSPWHLPPFLLLTQAIFQVVVFLPSNFPLKVTFHLNQALGVGTQTKTKGGEGWGNSQVQLHAQQLCAHSSCVHTAWCVYLQHLTDSIIMGSAIISSHQSNIKAITCVSAFSVVIKANSTVIYLRCVNIPAFSPSLVPHMLLASHH